MAAYRLSRNAKEDLRRIYVYGVEEFGEAQADEYFLGFFETFQKIASNPLAYQSAEHIRLGYRRCVYRSDTIYFRFIDSDIEITAILGGQDTDNWLWINTPNMGYGAEVRIRDQNLNSELFLKTASGLS